MDINIADYSFTGILIYYIELYIYYFEQICVDFFFLTIYIYMLLFLNCAAVNFGYLYPYYTHCREKLDMYFYKLNNTYYCKIIKNYY